MYLRNKISVLNKGFWVSLLLVSLGACSIKFVYNQMDWVIPGFFDDYVELNDEQEGLLDKRLQTLLRWHRTDQLPAYVSWLKQLEGDVANGLDVTRLQQHYQRVEKFLAAMTERMVTELGDIMLSLEPQQKQNLFKNFATKNREYEQEYVKRSEIDRIKQHIVMLDDNLEMWLGELQPQQKTLLAKTATKLHPIAASQLQSRLQWQDRLKSILDDESPISVRKQSLMQHILQTTPTRTSEHQNKLDQNRILIMNMVVNVLSLMDQTQREHLINKLHDYQQAFQELSQQTS